MVLVVVLVGWLVEVIEVVEGVTRVEVGVVLVLAVAVTVIGMVEWLVAIIVEYDFFRGFGFLQCDT